MTFLLFYAYLWAFMPENVHSSVRKRRNKNINTWDSKRKYDGRSPVVKHWTTETACEVGLVSSHVG